jgi:uncharacterized protein (DUF58 family)
MTVIWVFLTILAVAFLQNLLFYRRGLANIIYKRRFSSRSCHAGDEIQMVEEISNNKILPVPWLKVESRMPKALSFGQMDDLTISGDMYHRSLFFMGSFRKITRTHRVSCIKRGRCDLNSVSISAGSLLGFMNLTTELDLSAQVSIYPKLLSYDTIPELSKQLLGDIIVKRWISPDPFLINGIRPYVSGDNMKDVHWAATAKTGELKVKTHDYSASPNLLVLLNTEISGQQWGVVLEEETGPIEYGISLAATILTWAMKNGLKAGFGTNGYLCDDENKEPVYIPQDGGAGGIKNMLEAMCRIVIARKLTFFTYIDTLIERKVRDMDVLILTTYMTERLKKQTDRLKRYGNSIHIQMLEGEGHIYE